MAAPRTTAMSCSAGATITQAACEAASRTMASASSPIKVPPKAATTSASRTGEATAALLAGWRGVERLDHLFGDVHTRAGEHHVLQDQVVFLAFEDRLDDLVGALDDAGSFFVAALVQVFLELAALALQVTVLLNQITLAAVALGLGQRGRILLELVGRGLELAGLLVEVLVALAEVGLHAGERGLGRGGFAQHPLAVDVADLQLLRLRQPGAGQQGRQADQGGGGQGLQGHRDHQNAVPIWNWKRWILSVGNFFNGTPQLSLSGPTGEIHDRPKPAEERRLSPVIFSPSRHTLPASAKAKMRSDLSLPVPGTGKYSSVLRLIFLAPPM